MAVAVLRYHQSPRPFDAVWMASNDLPNQDAKLSLHGTLRISGQVDVNLASAHGNFSKIDWSLSDFLAFGDILNFVSFEEFLLGCSDRWPA